MSLWYATGHTYILKKRLFFKHFYFSDLLLLQLHQHVEDVEDIVEKANKESKIDAQLRKIHEAWRVLVLEFVPYKHADSRVCVIRVPEEIMQALEVYHSL